MSNILDSLANWWPMITAIFGAAIMLYRGLNKSVRKALHETVQEEIKPIQEQFKNNGGGSMKDAVDRLGVQLDDARNVAVEAKDAALVAKEVASVTHTQLQTSFGALGEADVEIRKDLHDGLGQVNDRLETYVDKVHEVSTKLDTAATQMSAMSERRASELNALSSQLAAVDTKVEGLGEQITAGSAKINAVTANLKAAYFEFDAEGELVNFNDSFLELLGLTYAEAVRKGKDRSFGTYVHPDDQTKLARSATIAYENKTEWVTDFRVVRPGGDTLNVIVRAFPIWDGIDFGGYAGALVEVPRAKEVSP